MNSVALFVPVTMENFSEELYLVANPDVAAAVGVGAFHSGYDHFCLHGHSEFRKQRVDNYEHELKIIKSRKLDRIHKIINTEMSKKEKNYFNALTDELRNISGISETENISANSYSTEALKLIKTHTNGLILDCGSGYRDVYYENVVNYEIKEYETTDVLGVAESLPFNDESFDAVFSFAVLEHVKTPWVAASEIKRVLKPGGDIIVNVPFLQPFHGYPHHYFNMTHMGVTTLFEDAIDISDISVPVTMTPVWTLTWFLRSWMEGLSDEAKENFGARAINTMVGHPSLFLNENFVTELSLEKNLELASGTLLKGSKKNNT